jgi:hypothetical protein
MRSQPLRFVGVWKTSPERILALTRRKCFLVTSQFASVLPSAVCRRDHSGWIHCATVVSTERLLVRLITCVSFTLLRGLCSCVNKTTVRNSPVRICLYIYMLVSTIDCSHLLYCYFFCLLPVLLSCLKLSLALHVFCICVSMIGSCALSCVLSAFWYPLIA